MIVRLTDCEKEVVMSKELVIGKTDNSVDLYVPFQEDSGVSIKIPYNPEGKWGDDVPAT